MLPKQREAAILANLETRGAVSVAELAKRLEVTGETIRRDLAKLADRGRLVRTHGGAVRPDEGLIESPFAVRRIDRAEQKRAIGQLAAQSIEPGDVIAIDASTTCFEVARQLPAVDEAKPITVVSNGLDVVRWLTGRVGVDVICTGGVFDADGACFIGPLAEAAFRRFEFDRAFLSCQGYDPHRGASESSPAHAALKSQILAQSDSASLLIDSSKIKKRSVCYFAPPDAFQSIICDAPSPTVERARVGHWQVAANTNP